MKSRGILIAAAVLLGLCLALAISHGQDAVSPTMTPSATPTETFSPMGATHEEAIKHFGYPVFGQVVSTEVDILLFHVKGGTIHIMFINGKAEQLDYHKAGFLDRPFTPEEVKSLAGIVGGYGVKWYSAETLPNTWINEDGSIGMYYGKDPDSKYQHTLSFISRKALDYLKNLKDNHKPNQLPNSGAPFIKI